MTLPPLKNNLDSDECTISEDAASIEYSYGIAPLIYRQNKDGTVRQIFPDSSLSALNNTTSAAGIVSSMTNQSVFTEMAEEPSLYEDQYDVKRPLAGKLQRGRSCAEFGWQHQRLRSLYSGH